LEASRLPILHGYIGRFDARVLNGLDQQEEVIYIAVLARRTMLAEHCVHLNGL
jgi:hypothetical protein